MEDDDVNDEMLLAQLEDSDEDEIDWEEVDVTVPQASTAPTAPHESADIHLDVDEGPSTLSRPNIEITLSKRTDKKGEAAKKKATGISHAERLTRIDCHKIHTVALLVNARIRNRWLNDELLQARLLSLTPLRLQNEFAKIHRSRIPEAPKRGHLFQLAITRLAEWWVNDFFEVESEGHLRSRTFDEIQTRLSAKGLLPSQPFISTSPFKVDRKGKGKAYQGPVELDVEAWQDGEDEEEWEVVRSEKSLMKRALQRYGSRDVSAQLFTALCRALGIPARLVVSLQSVPWQAGVGKPKTKPKPKPKTKDAKGKGKERASVDGEEDAEEDGDMEEVDIPSAGGYFPGDGQTLGGGSSSPAANGEGKGKEKAKPVISLRKSKSKGQTLASSRPPKPPDPTRTPPIFWTEVFSRADARWLPVDPIRAIINKRKLFDPGHPSALTARGPGRRQTRVDNRMSYVVAFEEDSYARDLTPRYAREYGAKVAKAQVGGKGRKEWWERVLGTVTRPYRLHRDDLEDEELTANQITEGMPTTMTGFKDHPLYVLSRHLLRDQEIRANAPELGKFRGEPVYPRSAVLSLKTAENWMRRGRVVREGEQPMKWVKQRASTIGRKRELEVLREAGAADGKGEGEEVMQGLYAERQTEVYVPEPVVDGRVPKNDFGNIDLYTSSMLPAGAAHLPHKGIAKVARQLGFDYAEAVTGFEFKKRRAFPVLTGIVVAVENEEAILEAYWEHEHNAAEKEKTKRQDAVIKRWTRLIQGLRIRKRLQEQYAGRADNPLANGDAFGGASENVGDNSVEQAGGFITGADDVVQPYLLPKYQHAIFQSTPNTPKSVPGTSTTPSIAADQGRSDSIGLERPSDGYELTEGLEEDDMMEVIPIPAPPRGAPKTMAELAAGDLSLRSSPLDELPGSAATAPSNDVVEEGDDDAGYQPSPAAVSTKPLARRTLRKTNGTANTTSASTNLKPKPKPKPTPRTATKAKTVAGRKRGRGARTRSDDESGEEQEHEEDAIAQPSPAKRRKAAQPPVVKSDRVLRTRKGKDASKVQEEQEREEAVREAIGESE